MEQMIAAMPKGAYPSINKNDIERFMIPVPALDVQKGIVAEVSECEKGIARAMATMDSAARSQYSVLKRYGVYV